jgi:ElaA protein
VSEPEIARRHWRDLDPLTAYRLLQLRAEVFVVEQECAYQDLDGRDLEPGVIQLWVEDAGAPVAGLRILPEPDGSWEIGRVVTAAPARGRGLSSRLMRAALAECGRPVTIKAQTYLRAWYESFGFEATGPEFLEDGIPHLPMKLS